MTNHQIFTEFTKKIDIDNKDGLRGIGVECELPVVTYNGSAVDISVIQNMFAYLRGKGFQLKKDRASNLFVAATSINQER